MDFFFFGGVFLILSERVFSVVLMLLNGSQVMVFDLHLGFKVIV